MSRPKLRAVPSTGAPKPRPVVGNTGELEWYQRPATACEGCGFKSKPGEDMTWYKARWWHIACSRTDLRARPSSAAWFALAEQLAKSPSSFKASEVRVIVRALLRIAVGPTSTDPKEVA